MSEKYELHDAQHSIIKIGGGYMGIFTTVEMLNNQLDEIANLKQQLKEANKAIDAYEKLSICYRVGKRPTEKLFNDLKKAREYQDKYKEKK